ncbi:unnamed protein product, partial [Tetraodon nigroviridis]
RSPESVEMDEIMAAMVLTSLSCSPVVQSPPQADPGAAGSASPADMECGGGELSDSGSSGYWSWDHGNVSPAPSPSVPEVDSSPDEGLHMTLDQGDELSAKKPKSSFRGVYKCLWPSCGKVLTSSVGIKRHIRVLHLGSGSDQSQREEDFYYTKISCETVDASSGPAPTPPAPPPPVPPPLQAALGQASSSHLGWTSCGSPPAPGLHIPPAHRPRSNSSSGPCLSRPGALSQSAPSSFWQIHSEHLYQACNPVQVSVATRGPSYQSWTPSPSVPAHTNTPVGPRSAIAHCNRSFFHISIFSFLFSSFRRRSLGVAPAGRAAGRPRNAAKCTGWSARTSGAPPAAGRKPASASPTNARDQNPDGRTSAKDFYHPEDINRGPGAIHKHRFPLCLFYFEPPPSFFFFFFFPKATQNGVFCIFVF